MTQAQSEPAAPIASAGEAELAIAQLHDIMDSLAATVEEETARVRDGRLREAIELEATKAELAHQYNVNTTRLVNSKPLLVKTMPDALDALRRRHETFGALLQMNLTVLATAHAVSEGIIRGVSGELARTRSPQTYGASGRANAPTASANQPLAVCRTL